MMMKLAGALLLMFLVVHGVECQLQVGFYSGSCGLAEFVVKTAVRQAFINDRGVAAGLLRMHFHDCFVRGCDGSVLIDSTSSNTAEKDSPPNNPSLRGFEVIDAAKSRLEGICGGVVSCADILAFAARDSVELSGRLGYDVPSGRRDGTTSLSSEASSNLPPPTSNVGQLTQIFANKGLSQAEMVTLSGGHTIDPTLDAAYATALKQQCPQGNSNANLVVPMDAISPAVLDEGYYVDVFSNRGMFTSDQTLMTNAATAAQVGQNAGNRMLWSAKFAAAMVKMGQIGVLTGSSGEIRANCRVVNS
ncbi:unnamed protein product [Linum tenue]|uniref:Peroxidase n=1 Tax=Linum tenue TaxID=586396 RepID=A0AAV0N400_9ROSI|nr:unnamed protein product [Linum tenue]